MKIQHFRNATLTIEIDDKVILVDPMLGDQGTLPPFSFFRFKMKKNPTVPLPENCRPTLEKVTLCLITHNHPDHIDSAAEKFLIERNIPVICSTLDEKTFIKKGLNVVQTINYWEKSSFLNGTIEGIPAKHGYGFVAKPAGNVMGFFIELPNQPSIYLSSDTIYTDAIDTVLKKYNPEISIVATGSAQFDIFKPLLMTLDDIVKFVENAPHKVIANHMEAVNHCPITRAKLSAVLTQKGLIHKTYIPEDGEVIDI
ncbi:MBL fold metallo-hydrolase [uncultured Tenacibaculum sp.]|uniref:MBL fold metallo-hydrolase n=1 Tax=uncultured Tenacibaculum sp. TaxID=174713 RepID=UPI002623C832|nr:MBL fold metallo-hydrolase [uncultured Tenacibaculum sp.]